MKKTCRHERGIDMPTGSAGGDNIEPVEGHAVRGVIPTYHCAGCVPQISNGSFRNPIRNIMYLSFY